MIYKSEQRDIRMTLTGDTMLSRRLRSFTEPDYQALVALMRDTDVAFTNLESCVREPDEGAANATLGTPMTTPPALLSELQWLGVNLVSCANNHAADYGVDGIRAMLAHLKHAQLPFAGIGRNLAEARAPVYLDTAAGRVALVATTTFFKPGDRAGGQNADAAGRPGLNPLGFARSYTVDGETFDVLARAAQKLGLAQEHVRHANQFFSAHEAPKSTNDVLNFMGSNFRRGNDFSISTRGNKADIDDNLRWVREARRQADWVIVSLHSHEFGAAGRMSATTDVGLEEPAEFAVAFARGAIDAGADIVAGHGPHLTLGVEIYKGRPILYSLGNFILENDTVASIPAESYARFGLPPEATPADFFEARTHNDTRGFPASPEFWEAVAASCEFRGGRLAALRLHPLDLGFGTKRSERGRPLIARGTKAKRILERVQHLSRHHNTSIVIEGETAVVKLAEQ